MVKQKHELDIPPFLNRKLHPGTSTPEDRAEYVERWYKAHPQPSLTSADVVANKQLDEEIEAKQKTKKKNAADRWKRKKADSLIPEKFREWSTRLGRFIDTREGEKKVRARLLGGEHARHQTINKRTRRAASSEESAMTAKQKKVAAKAKVVKAKAANGGLDRQAREKRVLDLHKKGKLSQSEIGAEVGLTQSGVWSILKRHSLTK